MKTYKVDFKRTGWIRIPFITETVVAHYKDGSIKVYDIWAFIMLDKREKHKMMQIDCYKKGETIPNKDASTSKMEDQL